MNGKNKRKIHTVKCALDGTLTAEYKSLKSVLLTRRNDLCACIQKMYTRVTKGLPRSVCV